MTHGSFRLGRTAAGQTMRWICWKHHDWNGLCWVCSCRNELISGGHSWICLSTKGVFVHVCMCALQTSVHPLISSLKVPEKIKESQGEDITDGFWKAIRNLGPTEHTGTNPGECLIMCWNFSVGIVTVGQSKRRTGGLVWARLLSFLQKGDSNESDCS